MSNPADDKTDLFPGAPGLDDDEPSSSPKEAGSSDANTADDSSRDEPPMESDGQPSDTGDEEFAQLVEALLRDDVRFPSTGVDLSARSNAYISEEMSKALPKLKMALQDAYDTELTKSLLVEVAVRLAVKDVVDNGEDSVVARWAKAQG